MKPYRTSSQRPAPEPRPAAVRTTLALTALLLLWAGPAAADPPRIHTTVGMVEIGTGDPPVWRAAHAGDALRPGDAIRVGSGGRAELDLGQGSVRLYENSVLRLPAAPAEERAPRGVDLERGSSLFDIDAGSNPRGFEVRTPEAVVMVKGTRFLVSLDAGAAAVSVFRGLVGVRSLVTTLEHEVLVRPGFTAVGGRDRPFDLRFERTPDPWKDWGQGQPPPRSALLEAQPPPAKIAVAEARRAALEAARPAIVARALERNPELAQALLEQVRAARAKRRERAGLEPKAEEVDPQRLYEEAVELGIEERLVSLVSTTPDPVAERPDETSAAQIHESVAEEVLNSSTGSTPGLQELHISLVTVGGLEQLVFMGTSGNLVAQFTEDQVWEFADGSNLGLVPQPIIDNVTASGLLADDYFALLADMFFGR